MQANWDAAARSMNSEFAYVVIGGGTAGCRIAERLASGQPGRVALVEAGPVSGGIKSVVPRWYPHLFGSKLDWNYQTEPIPGLGNRRLVWPRGKLLGGSGALNALIYLQAAAADFQRWGWDWAEQYAGTRLLTHAVSADVHAWSHVFVSACDQWGLSPSIPFDRAMPQSAGVFQTAQRRGRRTHSGQALVEPEKTLPNLKLFTDCQAERLMIDRQRVTGVMLRDAAGQQLCLRATCETVLSCGAIGTPWLLMQSGFGPADQLRQAGIECQKDVPGVGANLQDHLVFPLIYTTQLCEGLPPRASRDQRQLYREAGRGSLASNIAEAGCLFSLAERNEPRHSIDVQIHFTPTHYLKYPRSGKERRHCTLAVTDLHPSSQGTLQPVRMSGGDLQLAIQPNYLQTQTDIDRMLAAIRMARELASQPALKTIIADEALPGERRTSDAQLLRGLQAYAMSIYHPVGTCRMETPSDFATPPVVDAEFRLLGIEQLRIADASIIPDLPSCNTNAVTLLIAEHAASCMLRSMGSYG